MVVLATILAYKWGCAKPKEQDIGQKAQQYLQGVIDERVQHTEEGIKVDLSSNGAYNFYDKLNQVRKAYNNKSYEEKEKIKKEVDAILDLSVSPELEGKEKAKQRLEDLLNRLKKEDIELKQN